MLGIWLAVIGVALLVEFATQVQLVSVWAAVGGIAALLAELFGADQSVQILLFFTVTFASLALTRPFVRKLTKKVKQTPTNADMNIGKIGRVTKIVNADEGIFRVNVSGEDWSAMTENRHVPHVGAEVVVKEIRGVKLIVASE